MILMYTHTFNENSRCECHVGSFGHTAENYKALKYKVQEMIDNKLLTFKEESQNIKNNLLPGHTGPSVKALKNL